MFKRLLVCNSAHLGDIILTTAILPVLKSAYPQAEIGFLVGSWALEVVDNHTLVDHVHLFDHPCRNRSQKSIAAKNKQGTITRLQARKELKEKRYDVAFDFYSLYESNVAKLLFDSQIPLRIGWLGDDVDYHYYSQLFSFDYVDNCQSLHMVQIHGQLLQSFGVGRTHLEKLKPTLSYRNEVSLAQTPREYCVVHVGVGDKRREWDRRKWREFTCLLETLDLPIVFMGCGSYEKELISELSAGLKDPIDYCDKLSWRESLLLIQRAKFLVGLESMAGHVAAAMGTPAVLIYGGSAEIARWRPYNPCCQIVTLPSHYFDERGLAPVEAIQEISAEEVFQKVKLALGR